LANAFADDSAMQRPALERWLGAALPMAFLGCQPGPQDGVGLGSGLARASPALILSPRLFEAMPRECR
jgi:hypothetical protein